ncbi:hypothetical protein [uncultured Roseibium sp.]|uniref:hypothetical protein n=1 Tax=uncultured Roseibium sp. TaxID=1936171 RepID=UPI0026165BEE|nr:hypothetical protein [uncultured Roseibium sp.]
MTASIRNTVSSFKMLKKGIAWFNENKHLPADDRIWHVEILLDSFEKCMESLAAQIRFYQSAKSPTRALIVTHDDGSEEVVSGQKVQSLCLHVSGQEEDHVIYGKPEALAAIAEALAKSGKTVTGPAPVDEHAAQLAETAPETPKANVT